MGRVPVVAASDRIVGGIFEGNYPSVEAERITFCRRAHRDDGVLRMQPLDVRNHL